MSEQTITNPCVVQVECAFPRDFLREKGIKRVMCQYAYDERNHVHLCELKPYYELHPIRFNIIWEDGYSPTEDEVTDFEADLISSEPEVECMHCSRIDSIQKYDTLQELPSGEQWRIEWYMPHEEPDEDWIDTLRDFFGGNHFD